MFENKIINDYTYASRFIMSWVRAGGVFSVRSGYGDFEDWLKSLELSDDDVQYIVNLASNGKLELEGSARLFITNNRAKL